MLAKKICELGGRLAVAASEARDKLGYYTDTIDFARGAERRAAEKVEGERGQPPFQAGST